MTNMPPRGDGRPSDLDINPARANEPRLNDPRVADPRPAAARTDRRSRIVIGIVAAAAVVAAVLYFSVASQNPDNPAQTSVPGQVNPDPNAGKSEDTSGTPPATAPAQAPAENSGTTNQ
jgi:hypothetical protein